MKAHGLKPPEKPSPKQKKTSGVRFDDEVRVKSIQAKGRNRPVNAMFEIVREEDDGEEFGEKMLDSDGSEDDSEDGQLPEGKMDESESQDSDDEDALEDEGASDEGMETQDTIERLKDDLFADDDEVLEDTGASGIAPHSPQTSLSYIILPQTCLLMRSGWRHCRKRSPSSRRRTSPTSTGH